MAEKYTAKALGEKYGSFNTPVLHVYIGGKELETGDKLLFLNARVISSVNKEPDMAVLTYRLLHGAPGMEGKFQAGARLEIEAGYGDRTKRIFLGYLHEVDSVLYGNRYVEYTLAGLDVKGLMKKNSGFEIFEAKEPWRVLEDILDNGMYGFLIEEKDVDTLPESFSHGGVIKGETHFEWISSLAEYTGYSFYCGNGRACFKKALSCDARLETGFEYGVRKIRNRASLSGQHGCIRVEGYNRRDEKFCGTKRWRAPGGPYTGKMQEILGGSEGTFWSMGLQEPRQAAERAGILMERERLQCSEMEVVSVGLPELRPGMEVTVSGGLYPLLGGTFYVREAEHILDERGYTTVVRGSRK